jgi:membrane protease subunit (stomatin/prohibitin family)
MPLRFGRPGLIGTAARTAVVVGTAGAMQDRRMARHEAAAAQAQQQATPAPAPAEPAGDDLAAKIQELADLKDKGVLTDEEFAAAKAKLINS